MLLNVVWRYQQGITGFDRVIELLEIDWKIGSSLDAVILILAEDGISGQSADDELLAAANT